MPVSNYLKCFVGVDETNVLRMKQVHLLTKILGLTFICVGDSNATKDELIQSGWPNFMNCDVVLPEGPQQRSKALQVG